MFAVGGAVEWLFRRWIRPVRLRFEQATPRGLGAVAGHHGLRLALDLAAILVFAVVAMATFFALYQGHAPSRNFVMTYFTAVLIVRAASLVSRFVLAPEAQHVRMIPFDDATASYYHRCIVWFTGVVAFGLLSCALMRVLGLGEDLHMLLRMIVGLILIHVCRRRRR